MFSAMAKKAVKLLDVQSNMEAEDKELYEYGFHMLFAKSFFFLLSVLLGYLFHIIMESTVFFLLFSAIRSYAGGVHAKKESSCTILTSGALLAAIAGIKWNIVTDQLLVPLSLSFASAAIVLAYAPLDSSQKPLDQEERKQFRKTSCLLLLLIGAIAVFSLVIQRKGLFCACAGSLTLEGILLLAGHLKQKIAK